MIAVRPAGPTDAASVAEVYLASFGAALPTVRLVHTDDQGRRCIWDVVIPDTETWVVVDGHLPRQDCEAAWPRARRRIGEG